MSRYEHPGCASCACPKGLCGSENPDAVALYVMARGIPAYKVAQALNTIQRGIDFSGCSKKDMAESWDARTRDPVYKGLKHLTNEDLKSALESACAGKYMTPTQRTNEMLLKAQARAAARKTFTNP